MRRILRGLKIVDAEREAFSDGFSGEDTGVVVGVVLEAKNRHFDSCFADLAVQHILVGWFEGGHWRGKDL